MAPVFVSFLIANAPGHPWAAGWRVIGDVPKLADATAIEVLVDAINEDVRKTYGPTADVAVLSWRRLEE